MSTKQHKHHDLIVAWAKGAKIQMKFGDVWREHLYPDWSASEGRYRIKPEPKPDVITKHLHTLWNSVTKQLQHQPILFTIDGETGDVKSVELVK